MSRAKSAESQMISEERQAGLRIAQARRQLGVREHRDVSGPDMARALGVSAETARSWEAGESFPRKPALRRLADYLGVTSAWIEYGIEPREATSPREHFKPTVKEQSATKKRPA